MKNCCFWVRLETAGKIIGILSILLSIGSIVQVSLDHYKRVLPIERIYITSEQRAVYFILEAINIITSIFLLHGIVESRHRLIMPWLFSTAIALIFWILYFTIFAYTVLPVEIALHIVGYAIIIYAWLAIYPLYEKIKDQNKQQADQSFNNLNTVQYPTSPELK